MQITRKIFIVSVVSLITVFANSQQCGSCKLTPTIAQYDLDVQVVQPELKGEKTEGWVEWSQLFWLAAHANGYLFTNNKNCIRFTYPVSTEVNNISFVSKDGVEVPSLVEEKEIAKVGLTYTNLPPAGDVSRFGNYLITGSVRQQDSGYIMNIELQAACSRKVVASASVPFQASTSSEYMTSIAYQAASQLSPLIEKIKQFELKERNESDIISLDDNFAESIIIKPKKRNLAAGEQTGLEISLKDCDGTPLPNRKIVFTNGSLNGIQISAGTTGGTVLPESVITDANGKAKATFKMGNQKTAMIEAYHIYEKPYGCESVKLGSTPIGGAPVKVEISYLQNETRTVQRATLPGIKISGGEEAEQFIMFHTTVLYHYPAIAALKEGFLVEEEKDNREPGSRSEFIVENGYFDYKKLVQTAVIKAMMGNKEIVQAVEKGSQSNIQGQASLKHTSELSFFKGNANEPASFSWSIEYPASPDGEIAYGSMSIVKGEENVQWIVKPINDVNSPYKTEYNLSLKLDVAEELKKGNKAMKDLFGVNLDEMVNRMDPTDPKSNMAGARGTQMITVRILSPYAD
jgi:hypothetical protein